jgi:hypothetical protein
LLQSRSLYYHYANNWCLYACNVIVIIIADALPTACCGVSFASHFQIYLLFELVLRRLRSCTCIMRFCFRKILRLGSCRLRRQLYISFEFHSRLGSLRLLLHFGLGLSLDSNVLFNVDRDIQGQVMRVNRQVLRRRRASNN